MEWLSLSYGINADTYAPSQLLRVLRIGVNHIIRDTYPTADSNLGCSAKGRQEKSYFLSIKWSGT